MEWNITAVIGVGLMLLGFIGLVILATWKLTKWVSPLSQPSSPSLLPAIDAQASEPVVRNADAPPPVGIKDYVALIKEAAPFAEPVILWSYAGQGLTEAQVLRAEVARLGKNTEEA